MNKTLALAALLCAAPAAAEPDARVARIDAQIQSTRSYLDELPSVPVEMAGVLIGIDAGAVGNPTRPQLMNWLSLKVAGLEAQIAAARAQSRLAQPGARAYMNGQTVSVLQAQIDDARQDYALLQSGGYGGQALIERKRALRERELAYLQAARRLELGQDPRSAR